MTQAFQSIKQGLNEAINHARGDKRGVMVYQPHEVDVPGLRTRLGLTQGHWGDSPRRLKATDAEQWRRINVPSATTYRPRLHQSRALAHVYA